MSLNIRWATLDDVDKLVKARFDYFAIEKWEVSHEQHETIENNLRQYYLNYMNIDFFAVLVEVDNELASVAFLAISHKPATLSCPTCKVGAFFNVLTYPEHRKKGYANSAMKLLLDEARKQKLSYVELASTEIGKSLYQKLGFKELKPSTHFTDMKLSLL